MNDNDLDTLDEFSDTLGDIGCLTGEYKIKVEPSVDPMVEPPWCIPFASTNKVKVEWTD